MTRKEMIETIGGLPDQEFEALTKCFKRCKDCGRLTVGPRRVRCPECSGKHQFELIKKSRQSVPYPYDSYISGRTWTTPLD